MMRIQTLSRCPAARVGKQRRLVEVRMDYQPGLLIIHERWETLAVGADYTSHGWIEDEHTFSSSNAEAFDAKALELRGLIDHGEWIEG